jgi:UDP-N-acetylglucosamine 4-epimerase
LPLTGKHILITGNAGFIGSNLTAHFLSRWNKVTGLDNFLTGKKENILPFQDNAMFRQIEGDIRDPEVCKEAMKGIDIVLHQAALGSVPRSVNDPITTNDININGFLNVLHAAREAGVKRFIYAGSSSTYGDSAELPKLEERIGKPLSPYAVTKYVNELYADVFHRLYGMEIIGLRYFNVFGKNQDPDGMYAAAIPKFIKTLLSGQSPVIFGDGNNSRDFTYIANVIQANELAASTSNPDAMNQVYNVAFGERTSLNELLAVLKEVLAQYDPKIAHIKINYGPERQGEIPHSLASIEKAKSLLGYAPTHDLRKGLKEAVEWYVHHLNPSGITH